MYTYKIDADCNVTVLEDSKLETLQGAVDGWVELIKTPMGDLYVNDDGRMRGLPINTIASACAGQPIVGDVAFVCKTAIFDTLAEETKMTDGPTEHSILQAFARGIIERQSDAK